MHCTHSESETRSELSVLVRGLPGAFQHLESGQHVGEVAISADKTILESQDTENYCKGVETQWH